MPHGIANFGIGTLDSAIFAAKARRYNRADARTCPSAASRDVFARSWAMHAAQQNAASAYQVRLSLLSMKAKRHETARNGGFR
jgi:hypothetical protein